MIVNNGSSSFNTEKVLQFMKEHDINTKYLELLKMRAKYRTVLVVDDSASMNELADTNGSYALSRWDELCQMTKIIMDAHVAMNCVCDIYFLNRGFKRNVHCWEEIASYFQQPPSGHTYILGTMQTIFQSEKEDETQIDSSISPMIIHILTDGHPTNQQDMEDSKTLINCILTQQNYYPSIYRFSIILCINDRKLKAVYGNMTAIDNIDVIDVFRSELQTIQRIHGKRFAFTIGDYIMKILTSTIDTSMHNVDHRSSSSSACTSGCIIH